MPFTFLSHQAPVLPLKIAAPRWFDGTALVLGSMAPDLNFIVRGTPWYFDAHALPAQLWFCLPLTLVLTWVVKRFVAGPLGPHLPDLGRFHLRDYGRLVRWRVPTTARGRAIVVWSALIGTLSHVIVDAFTHSDGFMVDRIAALQPKVVDFPFPIFGTKPLYVYDLLQVGLSAIGLVITVALLLVIGRRRLVRDWYPEPDPLVPTTASRVRLWSSAAGGVGLGLAISILTYKHGGLQHMVIRWADIAAAGLLVGCVVARRRMLVTPTPATPGAARPAVTAP